MSSTMGQTLNQLISPMILIIDTICNFFLINIVSFFYSCALFTTSEIDQLPWEGDTDIEQCVRPGLPNS